MKNKFETKAEAMKAKKQNPDFHIYKFAGRKRKYPFFVGTWWDWLAQIS